MPHPHAMKTYGDYNDRKSPLGAMTVAELSKQAVAAQEMIDALAFGGGVTITTRETSFTFPGKHYGETGFGGGVNQPHIAALSQALTIYIHALKTAIVARALQDAGAPSPADKGDF